MKDIEQYIYYKGGIMFLLFHRTLFCNVINHMLDKKGE